MASDGDDGCWDAEGWLARFRTASRRRDSNRLRQLRVEVLHDTESAFARGFYNVRSGGRVDLSADSVPAATDAAVVRHDFFDGRVFPQITAAASTSEAAEATTVVRVLNEDCVERALALAGQGLRPALLNMASLTHGGGGYRGGAGAQEENLCRRSNLAAFLDPPPPARGQTRRRLYPLPEVGGLFVPRVAFVKGPEACGYPALPRPRLLDVVCVAALRHPPLVRGARGAAEPTMDADAELVTLDKIRAIFHIARAHRSDALVLGAIGCGAFCCPPSHVARLFRRVLLDEFWGCFAVVDFAVIDDHNAHRAHNPNGNFAPFHAVLDKLQPRQ